MLQEYGYSEASKLSSTPMCVAGSHMHPGAARYDIMEAWLGKDTPQKASWTSEILHMASEAFSLSLLFFASAILRVPPWRI